ncbi:MAG TPA: autotransporter-associated beta strand repeat-containing protein [Chthoniobacteraceae bacterium]|nr:autotransporter-associated beta strand repeat-containing protein [Chthoniobacteraceae bacterium]
MKTPEPMNRPFFRTLLLAGALALLHPAAHAADGTWSYAGNGDWFDEDNWELQTVADGPGAVAHLAGTSGRTIAIAGTGESVTLGEIALDALAVGWRLESGTIILNSGTPSVKALISGTSTSSGTTRLTIDSRLEGSSGLKITGGRYIFSNTGNTFTGGVELSTGAVVHVYAGAFGTNQITMADSGAQLQLRGGAHSNAILLGADNTLIAAGTNGAILSGTISEAVAGTAVRLLNNTTNCLLEISGNNSYSGDTTLGGTGTTANTTVRISSATAFGLASTAANVSFTAGSGSTSTLELTNNIDVRNRNLTLAGSGRDAKGSLRNLTGDNQWSGNVALGALAHATVGVEADTTLIIGGVVSGDSEGGLVKVGDGTLVLKNANTHATGTVVEAGRLVASHDQAVAGGDLALGEETVLSITTGVQLAVGNLTLGEGSGLEFHLGAEATATSLVLAPGGSQTGSGTHLIDIVNHGGLALQSYTLITGASEAFEGTDFLLGNTPEGFSGTLLWEEGALTLHVAAVPEPTSAALVGLGLAAFALGVNARRRFARSHSLVKA